MIKYSITWYIFFLTLFESIIKTHLTVHDSSHGFIGNRKNYLDDDFVSIHEEISSGLRSTNVAEGFKFQVKFDPSTLDFMHRPLGVPHLKKVTLYNFDMNKSIDMTSISGSTVHFHSSFFENKKIPPLGNTSFNVVFLGREEGFMESSLFIHTSDGHFKYDVKGISVYSPYRLRPIVGVKLPVNATFSPIIYLHNPHSEPIQILEVYTSGGDFHLELPSGEKEGPKDMWTIPPLVTKAVIRIKFVAKVVQNYTAYIRIKLNVTDEILVVPLEVEVSGNGGIFNPQGSLDFGIGGSLDVPKSINLCLQNPYTKPVRIHSVTSSSKAIQIEYEHVKLMPHSKTSPLCDDIAKLTINWKSAFETKDFSGKITVKYRNGKVKIEIPYYVTILEGGVSYDPQLTRYYVYDDPKNVEERNFIIRNDFASPLMVTNLTLAEDVAKFFTVDKFKSIVIQPKKDGIVFNLKLKNKIILNKFNLSSEIFLHTNISDIKIPIITYDGKLQLHFPFKSKDYSLDLGLISFDSKKEVYFLVYNKNPVTVNVRSLKSSIPLTNVEIMGCGKDHLDTALLRVNFEHLRKCSNVRSGEYAVIKLVVQTAHNEGHLWGELQIETPFENLPVPIQFKVATGKLEIGPDRLVFDECFPGKICSHPLRVHSTFNELMIIEDLIPLPPDPRISSKHSGHILGHTSKVIGNLYLDPNLNCKTECYTGLHHVTTAQWLKTLNLSKSVLDFDVNLVNVFYNRYLNLTTNGLKKWQNLTLRLDTSEVRGHLFKTRVKMSWPSLLLNSTIENKSILNFPLTQIGNVTYQNITIRNPSGYNLVVQIVMDKDYPGIKELYEGLPLQILPKGEFYSGRENHSFIFHENYKKQYYDFLDLIDIDVPIETIPIILKPSENYTFTVGFHGTHPELQSALILIRNNLTILEAIRLNGHSVHPGFKFGNRKPGMVQPLSFELTEKHLKECTKDKYPKHGSPNLTVKRSFTARNTGEVPIYVNGFSVNGLPCEGYGFKVFNCFPFVLLPNQTRKVDIAFTPDFTLTKVVRTLTIDTSINMEVFYKLEATIPPFYLNACSNLIARPTWEWYIKYVTVYIMFGTLFLVIFLAIIDADRVNKQTMSELYAASSLPIQPVLDLRLVGQEIKNEIRSNKPEPVSDLKPEKKDFKLLTSRVNTGETLKMKQETEKSPALIPVASRGRKRLGKRNSHEFNEFNEIPKTSNVEIKNNNCKGKSDVGNKMEEKKVTNGLKDCPRKMAQSYKKSNKNSSLCDEDFSLWGTFEYTFDDSEQKENDQRITKNGLKKCNSNKSEPEIVKDTKPLNNKLERNNNTTKRSRNAQHKVKTDSEINNRVPAKTHEGSTKKSQKASKDRKEKQTLCKRLSNEKISLNKPSDGQNASFRSSPLFGSTIWTENRATFSDVVARSDPNVSLIRPPLAVSSNPIAKPTVYVEPYKQQSSASGLGPIGSKPEMWHDCGDGFSLSGDSQRELVANTQREVSNSYFSNLNDITLDNSKSYLEEFINCGSKWDRPETNAGLESHCCGDNTSSSMQDPWNRNLLNSNSYWTSAISTIDTNQNNTPNNPSSYLWGSSSVWQPWTPLEEPRTPTRTPPGFDALLQQKKEEQTQTRQQQREETYNPFTTSNIWTHNPPNLWNYHHQQQQP